MNKASAVSVAVGSNLSGITLQAFENRSTITMGIEERAAGGASQVVDGEGLWR